MTAVDINDFLKECECIYRGEHYSARDNGAVLRHPRKDGRARAADGQWTFGKENSSNPYLHISGVQVHRIIATAFHGQPEDSSYVVDHIDTNCRNNRPENVRWLTRLENVLKNPITRRKVEHLCGSIEAFLDNPSLLRDVSGNPNFEWMRTVSPDEARNCKTRMAIWAGSPPSQRVSSRTRIQKPQDPVRMYQPLQKWEAGLSREPGLDFAMTPRSAQYMWSSAVHFPCCPPNVSADPLEDYARNARTGVVLAYCDDPEICPELAVDRVSLLKEREALLILCKRSVGGWTIVGIEISSRAPHFIHFELGSYTSQVEADSALLKLAEVNFWSVAYDHAYKNR